MFEVIYKSTSAAGTDRFGETARTAWAVFGTYQSQEEAAQVAATLKADGEKSAKVRAVKLTAEQAKRAAFLASFGQTYARKDAEPAGTWVAGKGV